MVGKNGKLNDTIEASALWSNMGNVRPGLVTCDMGMKKIVTWDMNIS